MKNVVVFVTLVFLCLAQTSYGASDERGPVRLQSIRADFVQEKHLKILTRPIVSIGTFTFQAPQSLRWEYQTPISSILLMHGSKIRRFVQKDGELTEERGVRFDFMQVVLTEIGNWLDGRFTDNDMFKVSFPEDHIIHLTPKKKMLAGLISKIELTLAGRQGLLDGVKIFEDPDSYTMITFKNRVLNQDLPASIFTKR